MEPAGAASPRHGFYHTGARLADDEKLRVAALPRPLALKKVPAKGLHVVIRVVGAAPVSLGDVHHTPVGRGELHGIKKLHAVRSLSKLALGVVSDNAQPADDLSVVVRE